MTAQRLSPAGDSGLAWPRETALGPAAAGLLLATGSNVVLDLHGDPLRARLAVFSDGNHHMALADAVAAFAKREPGVGDVFYATTPPRILIEALNTGRIELGNLALSVQPHVFISPLEILNGLHRKRAIGEPRAFAASLGTAILVRRGNPLSVYRVVDLVRPDVRLALSNPLTEQASFSVYASAILTECTGAGMSPDAIAAKLHSDGVVKSRVIHHREVPEMIAAGEADASLVYRHLALRYVRAFPDLFDMQDGTAEPVTHYAIAQVGSGGEFGATFMRFMCGQEVQSIYCGHGLQALDRPA